MSRVAAKFVRLASLTVALVISGSIARAQSEVSWVGMTVLVKNTVSFDDKPAFTPTHYDVLEQSEGKVKIRHGGQFQWVEQSEVVLLSEAEEFFLGAIDADPEMALPLQRLAAARALLGQRIQALKDVDAALKLDPKLADAWYTKATLLSDKAEALKLLNKVVREVPDCIPALIGRAYFYSLKKDSERVIRDCTAVLAIDDTIVFAWTFRAMEYYRLKKYAEAIEDFTRAMALNPKDLGSLRMRAMAYGLSGQDEKAIEDFDKVLKVFPYDSDLLHMRSYSLRTLGNFEAALKDLEQVIKLAPETTSAYLDRAMTLKVLKRYIEASDDFDTFLQYSPADPSRVYRAALAIEMGKHREALEDCDLLLKIYPTASMAYHVHYLRGQAHMGMGAYELAQLDFEKSLELRPANGHQGAKVFLIRIWACCPDETFRQVDKAVEEGKKLCEATEYKDGLSLEALAAAEAAAGNFSEAVRLQKLALEDVDYAAWRGALADKYLALYEAGLPCREP